MGTQKNQVLVRYFSNRKAWLIEPDNVPPLVAEYPGAISKGEM